MMPFVPAYPPARGQARAPGASPLGARRRGNERIDSSETCIRIGVVTGRILLIEDDPRLAEMVQRYLGEAGFDVVIAPKGELGIARHAREGFDCIILDLTLPDIDGLDVCRRIRAQAQTPILMLTARGDAMDRVVGLELGADDYLPKPFEPRELLARVKAILRRGSGPIKSDLLRFGRLEIDRGSRE